ncbi:FtsL-like putative cell division protein [Tenacibaculum aquimarinum]|uniref:FtsL-like putative cell division protein n=1 Tax=Tenacibaculum aquimarinum TaxID=2910675 RepID=UPI001F0B26C7|nr:FtsL-like putative cell division protein [Tenacibaculum aquimarinum]MCH3885874.1 S-adenosyl-methyltransferase [Tenacibaculum aquimarinum]
MNKVKKNVYGILRGSFLTDESAFKNWRIIIFIVGLLLIMISSAHRADEKVVKIATLNKKKRELHAEFVDTGTILTRMKMESSIRKKVKTTGLETAKTPPQKIKVTINKE